ncbi:MAG: DUF362 domain-containing protein [Candidatus Kuenenia sp.]|nr:DUF362 domain-containing protein [Candidatus Kuenenia sp.]
MRLYRIISRYPERCYFPGKETLITPKREKCMRVRCKDYTRRDFLKGAAGTFALSTFPATFTSYGDLQQKKHFVYIKKYTSYDKNDFQQLKNCIGEMVASLYQINPFFSYGDKISLKINLVATKDCLDLPAGDTYVTNPLVVKALGEVLLDLGAGSLFIVEGSTHPSNTMEAFTELGYDVIASQLKATLIDLNKADPYPDFTQVDIERGLIYDSIAVNNHLAETDCLITVSKLKVHSSAGVTLSLKNMIGLLPIQKYGTNGTGARMQYVHSPDQRTQIPYNIVDIARVFPVDFAVIDGISAIDKGEGPWVKNISYVTPGVLVAGDNAVAVDSIGTAIMGFSPETAYPYPPFVNCYNHIQLASSYGLGSNNLNDIAVLGEKLKDVMYPYTPPDQQRTNAKSYH